MVKRMLQNLGILGTLAGAVAGSYFLGRSDGARESENISAVSSESVLTPKSLDSHTLAVLRLKNALGDRLEDEARLYEMSSEQLNLFAEVYEDVDGFERKYDLVIDEDYKEFNPLNPSQLSLADMTRYEDSCSWNLIPDNAQYSKADKAGIYLWAVNEDFKIGPIAPVW